MNRRTEFHERLSTVPGLADAKTMNGKAVYFQPPASVRLEFPCIIYDWSRVRNLEANNFNYIYRKAYSVTIIDRDPDSKLPDWLMLNFQYCSFDRHYVADNLHHWVFTIYN